MEKLKLLQKACNLFKQGKFEQCKRVLESEKSLDQDVTPLQWVLKNNHIVSRLCCQTCHKELQSELNNLLCQVKGIPPSRHVLPVELTLTFNYYLLVYKEYQCNGNLCGINAIIDSINSTWLRVCRAANVVIVDSSTEDYFVKAVSCSLSGAELRQPLLLLGCLQSVCHLTSGNIEGAVRLLDVVSRNMSILSKTEKVHFRFLPGCSVNVQEEIQTSKDSICNSYGIYALKLLHAVVHSVKGNRLKGMTSLMKPIELDRSSLAVSAWYWSMFCLYWEEKYSDVINGVNSVVNGNILSVRDQSIVTNLLACSLMKQNRITAAIALLRQCLQENFSYLLPLYNLSVMYGKQERVTAKLESLHLLTMALHQENKSVMKKEPAILLDAAHGKSKPKIIVQNIIEWQPSSLLVFYMLARSCLDAGRFSDAADHYIDLLSALTDLSCVPSTAHKACESGQQELPSLVTIYYESALSQTKSGRLLDALLIIKKIQEKLPHPPTYCANPGKVEHPSTSSVQEDAVEDQSDDGTFPGRKRQREMSESHFQLEASDDRVNENFYSYVKIRLLEVFCLVRCHRVEEALNCIDSVLKLLNKCQGVHKKEMQHSSKKIKLDQGDMPASIANVENQSEHPVLRLKAEAYNNKAVILIGQNKLQDANELLLNSIHCCPGFVDAVYNHTLLLFKLGNQSAASTDWLRFRYADVALNSSMVSHLLAKTASSLKDIKLVPSSPSVESIPQYSLLMMDKIALEIRMNVNIM